MPVGHLLATERRKQGRSLADVERATKIMGRMLDALEHERWDDLPAPVPTVTTAARGLSTRTTPVSGRAPTAP